MHRALVTGATGFIGGHLVRYLAEEGIFVRCLVRPHRDVSHLEQWGAEIVRGDIREMAAVDRAVAGTDVVFNLAAMTRAVRRRQLFEVNAGGARAVAQSCARQSSPPVHVLVSSLAAAGPARRHRPRTEQDPPCPISDYGLSKRASELAAAEFCAQVPTTVVRPGVVFGPQNREMILAFRSLKWLRLHIVPRCDTPPLSLLDVRDLLPALLAAGRSGERLPDTLRSVREDRSTGYYLVADQQHVTYAQLGRMMATAMGIRLYYNLYLIEPYPWFLAGLAELVSQLRNQPMEVSIDKLREATAPSWAVRVEKARRELGFSPAAPLQQRMQETVDWYRANRWL